MDVVRTTTRQQKREQVRGSDFKTNQINCYLRGKKWTHLISPDQECKVNGIRSFGTIQDHASGASIEIIAI